MFKEIKQELDDCKNPLYLFHDDPDGLISFLLLYRYKREGHGSMVKASPNIDEKFLKKVQEYDPDKIFILDIAMVDQEFIDKAKTPIVWIDHHFPLKRSNVKYFNPRVRLNRNLPTSYICYKTVMQDIWLAMIGCIGDWHIPDFAEEFNKDYPNLLPEKLEKPEQGYFQSEVGRLIKMISFNLKGQTKQAMKAVDALTKIKSPYEILKKETENGRLIYKNYKNIDTYYKELLSEVSKEHILGKMLIFIYPERKCSLTKELSNELIYKNPDKIVIVGREKSGDIRMSLRSATVPINIILENALKSVNGYGGGHEYACGANVKKEDFDKFISNIQEQLK